MMEDESEKIFGIIGNPVEHSLSPVMHNAAFVALGMNASYKKFKLDVSDLPHFFEQIRQQKIAGVNVTIPYKQAVLNFIDVLTPQAKKIGAVNTVYFRDGQIHGHNTDGLGYVASLKQDTKIQLKDKHVLVFGAGGAGLAICHALCEAGIKSLIICNRSSSKAKYLTDRLKTHYRNTVVFSCDFKTLVNVMLDQISLVVNTTSLGMNNQSWNSLSFLNRIKSDAVVSDIVYNPKNTELLQGAKNKGFNLHYGLGMLLQQGILAFESFTQQRAPFEVMQQALENQTAYFAES